jgi:hypothetical protein
MIVRDSNCDKTRVSREAKAERLIEKDGIESSRWRENRTTENGVFAPEADPVGTFNDDEVPGGLDNEEEPRNNLRRSMGDRRRRGDRLSDGMRQNI